MPIVCYRGERCDLRAKSVNFKVYQSMYNETLMYKYFKYTHHPRDCWVNVDMSMVFSSENRIVLSLHFYLGID